MGIFSRRNKNDPNIRWGEGSEALNTSYRNCQEEYTMFTISRPWGYYPPEVEEKIAQYEDTIQQLTDSLEAENRDRMAVTERLNAAQNELRNLHLEMANLELPDASDVLEHQIFDDFRRYNQGGASDTLFQNPEPDKAPPEPKTYKISINHKKDHRVTPGSKNGDAGSQSPQGPGSQNGGNSENDGYDDSFTIVQ